MPPEYLPIDLPMAASSFCATDLQLDLPMTYTVHTPYSPLMCPTDLTITALPLSLYPDVSPALALSGSFFFTPDGAPRYIHDCQSFVPPAPYP